MRDVRGQKLLFVTGRLAESSLREVLEGIAPQAGFRWEIAVPGIQVAALLHTNLLKRRLQLPPDVDRVILPGWCQGDIEDLSRHFGTPFESGPRDLYELPEFFGTGKRRKADLSRWSIEIVAEINHATRLPLADVLAQAQSLAEAGADIIDVGGVPGESSPRIAELISLLKSHDLRVSIDSFDRHEVEQAVAAGAELILSCNHSNVDWVAKLGVEVVAIPDSPQDLDSLDRLASRLDQLGCRFRLDPILEPIGMGFAASLGRCQEVRRRHPQQSMLMGVGNVTELSEVDSAGVNLVLAAFCEELGIQSVLTTQVANWCRTAVAEFNLARRLVHHALTAQTIPKHLDSRLVMLRDSRLRNLSLPALTELARALTDPNYRIHAEQGELHLMNSDGHWHGVDPFTLFAAAEKAAAANRPAAPVDASHAFYLGYELARAQLALQLGKQYVQDQPLRFGIAGESGWLDPHG
ncbi:MAG: DUF6513 domain-containing protein [Planctomycetota bacterium]